MILPWFGGSSAVWATCMLFFQAALLAGYTYAHVLHSRVSRRNQTVLHIALCGVSLLLLPILPDPSWKPGGGENPSILILGLLTATIGLQYFLLSTTSPLLQAWYSQANAGAVPYRLFALSNFASLLALLSYPVFVEPNLTSRMQAYTWSGGYVLFTLLCAATAWMGRNATPLAETEPGEAAAAPDWKQALTWMALAACPSILLLAVTQYLTQDVASIPFLWIVPLVIYLLSFMLCFESKRLYWRPLYLALLPLALAGMAYILWPYGKDFEMPRVVAFFLAALFVACMVCHGELARIKPDPRHLTGYYVMISVGGAIGGLFVGFIAPNLFNAYYEMPVALVLTASLIVLLTLDEIRMVALQTVVLVALGGFLGGVGIVVRDGLKGYLFSARNFYGQLRVEDEGEPNELEYKRKLNHGVINHGAQMLHGSLRMKPTTYYCVESGVGMAVLARVDGVPQKVGVIGLGAGTLASYGRPGDTIRIYEINPLVIEIATHTFSFLKESKAKVETVLGDARLSLEREAPQGYDVIAVDAFSGDSIPVHLLTREAFGLYFKHIKPGGILAVHISNKYLDLKPVVSTAAEHYGKAALMRDHDTEKDDVFCSGSTWILVMDKARMNQMMVGTELMTAPKNFRAWTDDFSNLYSIVKW